MLRSTQRLVTRPILTTCLLTTTVLAMPWLAASAAETATSVGEPRPFDAVTRSRAIREMAVVNRAGRNLGSIEDLIVDFGDRTVLYALLRLDQTGQGNGAAEVSAENERETGDAAGNASTAENERETGDAAGDASTAENERESGDAEADASTAEEDGDVARNEGDAASEETRFYPIPVEALQIAEVTDGEQTGEEQASAEDDTEDTGEATEQTAGAAEGTAEEEDEAFEEMAEGEESSAGTDEQMAADDQGDGGSSEATALEDLTVGSIVGMPVHGSDGEEISAVDAIVMDQSDRPLAVMGVGGFLGIGEKTVGLELDRLELAPEGNALIADVTREELDEAPELDYAAEQEVPEDARLAQLVGSDEGGTATADAGEDAESVEPAAGPAEGEEQQAEGEEQQAQGEESQDEAQTADSEQPEAGREAAQADQDEGHAEESSLEGMVLVLDVAPEELEKAPSFALESFPDMADAEWHHTILGFYATLLETPMTGVSGEPIEPAAGPADESDADPAEDGEGDQADDGNADSAGGPEAEEAQAGREGETDQVEESQDGEAETAN